MSLPPPPPDLVSTEFDAIYREHRASIKAALRGLYVEAADLEDVTQEVFVVLYEALVAGKRPTAVRSWLFQIARRVASTHRRGRRRHRRKQNLPWRNVARLSPEDAVARREAETVVETFLEDLDPDACRAFVLAEVEGLRGKEVARRLGIATPAAYARVRAVRKRFDRHLRRQRTVHGERWFAWMPFLPGKGGASAARRMPLWLTSGGGIVGTAAFFLLLFFLLRGGGPSGGGDPGVFPGVDDDRGAGGASTGGPVANARPKGVMQAHTQPFAGSEAIRGRVEDYYGGPIAGAQLSLKGRDEPVGTSDDEGHFTIWARPGETSLEVGADGYASLYAIGIAPSKGMRIRLTAESTIQGKVFGPDGRPVAGIPVQAEILSDANHRRLKESRTYSDANGNFVLSHLHPTAYAVRVRSGGLWGGAADTVSLGMAEHRTEIDIHLAQGIAISGQIVDEGTGNTCPHPRARLVGPPGWTREVSGDSHGLVNLTAPPARGTHDLRVSCTGYLPRTIQVPASEGAAIGPLTWSLTPGATVTGTVQSSEGPVAGARVQLLRQPSEEEAEAEEMEEPAMIAAGHQDSGSDGSFTVNGLVPGEYLLIASAPGLREHRQRVQVSHEARPRIAVNLERGLAVAGRVRDETGAAVSGVQVLVQATSPAQVDPQMHAWQQAQLGPMPRPRQDRGAAHFAMTDDEGRFEITGLAPGQYGAWTLSNPHANPGRAGRSPFGTPFLPERSEGTRFELDAEDTEIELVAATTPAGRLRGQVLDSEGDAVLDAAVFVRAVGQLPPELNDLDSVHTDADGRFEIEGLHEDQRYIAYVYRYQGGSAAPTQVRAGETVTLQVHELARVRGKLRWAGGQPRPGQFIMLDALRGEPVCGEWDHREIPLHDPTGHFAFEVPPGRWSLRVVSDGRHDPVVLELKGAEQRDDLEIEMKALPEIRGRLVHPSGEAVKGWSVVMLDAGVRRQSLDHWKLHRGPPTSPEGQFFFRDHFRDFAVTGPLELFAVPQPRVDLIRATEPLRIIPPPEAGVVTNLGDIVLPRSISESFRGAN